MHVTKREIERERAIKYSRGRLTLVVAMCVCVCVYVCVCVRVPTCSAHFYLFKEIKERISEVLVFLSIECAR